MKTLLTVTFFFLYCWALPAQEHTETPNQPTRIGLHGMVLFSDGQALYASHLPMFHSPHDIQLIMQIEISDKDTHTKVVNALVNGSTYWTLAPEHFDLNLLGEQTSNGFVHFSADVYHGHFERNGIRRFISQKVKVHKIILKNTLSDVSTRHTKFIRITPLNSTQHFYARFIQGRPSSDQLFFIQSDKALPNQFVINATSLQLNRDEVASALGITPESVELYYQEQGDLQ